MFWADIGKIFIDGIIRRRVYEIVVKVLENNDQIANAVVRLMPWWTPRIEDNIACPLDPRRRE